MFYQIGQLAVRSAKSIYQKCTGAYSANSPEVNVKLAGGHEPLIDNTSSPNEQQSLLPEQQSSRLQQFWRSWGNPIAASTLSSFKSIYSSVILTRVIMISAGEDDEFFENFPQVMYVAMALAGTNFIAGLLLNKLYGIDIEHTNPVQESAERIALTADFCARYGTVEPTSFGLALGGLSTICYFIENHGSNKPTLHKAGGGVGQIRQQKHHFDIMSFLRASSRFFDLLITSVIIPYATYSGMVLALSPSQPSGEPLPEVALIAIVLGSARTATNLAFKFLEYRVLEHKSHLTTLTEDPLYKVVRAETALAGSELNYWEGLIAISFIISIKDPNIISSANNPLFWASLLAPLPLGAFGAFDALTIYDREIKLRQPKALAIEEQGDRLHTPTIMQSLKSYFFNPNINIQVDEINCHSQETHKHVV